MDFTLQALKCNNCGSGLTVEVNDFITYCVSCGSGFDFEDGEMKSIEINFASAAIAGEGEVIYKPFWYLKTYVRILERKTSGILFGRNTNSECDLTFYIPAFYCELNSFKNISRAFTVKNPVASPQKYNAKLTGFAYGKEDAKKFAEFMLISLEAEKSDMMQEFRYEIDYKSTEILGIPCHKQSDGSLRDAILGLPIVTS